MSSTQVLSDQDKSAKKLALIVYGLYGFGILTALGMFASSGGAVLFCILSVIGITINLAKKDDVVGTIAESHFQWQTKTIFIGLAGLMLTWILAEIFAGLAISEEDLLLAAFSHQEPDVNWFAMTLAWLMRLGWFAVAVWYVYRVIRGGLYLNDNKPTP